VARHRNRPDRGAVLARPVEVLGVVVDQQGHQMDVMPTSELTDEVSAVEPKATAGRQVRQRLGNDTDIHSGSSSAVRAAPPGPTAESASIGGALATRGAAAMVASVSRDRVSKASQLYIWATRRR
jgi:hypothetical protein